MDGEDRSLRRRDLIDQSKLRIKRGKKQAAQSRERINSAGHQWEGIAVGRVCLECKEAQAKGEFQDTPCSASA